MSATLIPNVRIFDGVSVISECGHVLIESGRIAQISLKRPLSPTQDCTVVDDSGCTLLPGLIDAHVHVYQDVSLLETAIQNGVTTVLDMHNEPEWFKEINIITKQRNDVSDVKSACFGATIANGWPSAIVKLVSKDPDVGASKLLLKRIEIDAKDRLTVGFPSGLISQTKSRLGTSLPGTALLGPGMSSLARL